MGQKTYAAFKKLLTYNVHTYITQKQTQAEAQDDWRFDDTFRQREGDAQQGPFFGHGAG